MQLYEMFLFIDVLKQQFFACESLKLGTKIKGNERCIVTVQQFLIPIQKLIQKS